MKTCADFVMTIVVKPMIVDDDTIRRMNTVYIKPKIHTAHMRPDGYIRPERSEC
jgi:hypothetical protein